MRISDWSSDVCSSDLRGLDLAGALHVVGNRVDAAAARRQHHHPDAAQHRGQRQGDDQPDHRLAQRVAMLVVHRGLAIMLVVHHIGPKKVLSTVSLSSPSTLRMVKTTSWRPLTDAGALSTTGRDSPSSGWARTGRSEEHTSELQTLMRNSYVVF